MSLLSAAEQEIEEIFQLPLVIKYVTSKTDDDDDEPELPTKTKEQTVEEWRDACVDAKAEAKRTDCIFRAGKTKMDGIIALGGKRLVAGAPYVVFEGTLSEKAFNAYKEEYGKPCTPKAVEYSLRYLAKKKHGEVKQPTAPTSPNRKRGPQNFRGHGNGRGGYGPGGSVNRGWQPNRFQPSFWNGGVQYYTPSRPGFA